MSSHLMAVHILQIARQMLTFVVIMNVLLSLTLVGPYTFLQSRGGVLTGHAKLSELTKAAVYVGEVFIVTIASRAYWRRRAATDVRLRTLIFPLVFVAAGFLVAIPLTAFFGVLGLILIDLLVGLPPGW